MRLILILLLCTGQVFAEPARDQAGSFDVDLTLDEADPFKEGETNAIQTADKLLKISTGEEATEFGILDNNTLNHLAGSYLWCSINRGPCPMVLDTVLEIDVINSKLSGKNSCPNMKQFWKLWIKADMEERLNYQVKTAFLGKTGEFKQKDRPSYIRCDEKLKAIMKNAKGAKDDFLKNRYSATEPKHSIQETHKLMIALKQQVGNVLKVLGAAQ